MLTYRGQNENSIYQQQTAAAAKPLNQGVKGLGNKTPGKVNIPPNDNKNDENAPMRAPSKQTGKTNNVSLDAFVTPANNRVRAILGNKTTNAKSVLQNRTVPVTEGKVSLTQRVSPRLRHSKIKVHDAETATSQNVLHEDNVPEVEYMPPRGEPLPDYPDDVWPHDREYPQFEGDNFMRGWASTFMPRKLDANGDEVDELDGFEEECREVEERKRMEGARKHAQSQKSRPAASTIRAQDAAMALSTMSTAPNIRNFAAPTMAAKARQLDITNRSKGTVYAIPSSSNTRHVAAQVTSRNTIGYAKGRQVSASARHHVADIHTRGPGEANVSSNAVAERSLAELLGLYKLDDDDDVPNALFDGIHDTEEEGVYQIDDE